MFAAAKRGDIVEIRRLLAEGFDPNALDENNVPALAYAEKAEEVEMLLLEQTDSRLLNRFVLHGAALQGWTGFIVAAIKKGADPAVLEKDNASALYYAACRWHLKTALVLLRNTPSEILNKQVSLGQMTVLHVAADWGGMSEFVIAAIKKGADPYIKDLGGRNVFDIVDTSRHLDAGQKQALKAEMLAAKTWADSRSLVFSGNHLLSQQVRPEDIVQAP